MEPALRDGDWVIVAPLWRPPRPGEIVLARDPRVPERLLLKRVARVEHGSCTLLGEAIEARMCGECWREWLSTQIRVINHYGLRPAQREDREKLYDLAREFLQLATPAETVGGRGAEPPDASEV